MNYGEASMSFFKSWAFALCMGVSLPLVLSGCQQSIESQGFNKDPAYWQNMQERLSAIQSAHFRGRFIYTSPEDKFSANFDYVYTAPNTYTLTLRSSLGTEYAKLIVTPQEAKLQASSREFQDKNPRDLFINAFNIDIPFDYLPQLILGRALPNSIFTPQGILYKSNVDNFEVTYSDYNSYGAIALPKDFTVQAPNVRLTIQTREVLELK